MSELPDDRALLQSAAVDWRLEGIRKLSGDRDALAGMLNDDAPFLFGHGGKRHVSEVRMRALVALQDLYRRKGLTWDLGAVQVRKAMSAADAEREALAALARLPEKGRNVCIAEAEGFLNSRVEPFDRDRAPLRAYRILQQLSLVTYELQEPLPTSLLTPLQIAVQQSQLQSERPTPHLKFSGTVGAVGFVYVDAGQWVLDFAEGPEGERIQAEIRAAVGREEATTVNDLSKLLSSPHEVVE